jgi:hypothetical protein
LIIRSITEDNKNHTDFFWRITEVREMLGFKRLDEVLNMDRSEFISSSNIIDTLITKVIKRHLN